ncbi:MAG TPA: chloramphenicol acetyltransferase [Pyrinomonadaceae bacterium]|nr:chloramphenicol acetyltransferase [Pyrinomonadaceae bacterium]
MSGYLDIETWNRRRQFEFFKDYANPFFNICAEVDVTRLRGLTRFVKDISFLVAYHFFSIKAANEVEQFRYRLRGDRVLVHDRIHAGTTLLLADETFTFVYFDYTDDFAVFHARAVEAIESAKAGASDLDQRADRDDLIYHSVIPWITFTSISHARKGDGPESVPKITFGKYREDNDRIRMPVSVEVHHALMDGLHVGRYFEKLESYLSDPRSALGL